MYRFIYNGPVVEYGVCISNNWRGETVAVSESKARSNLAYQFKKKNNRMAYANISLPGKLIKEQMYA